MCDSILQDIIEISSIVAVSGISVVQYLHSRIYQEELEVKEATRGYRYFEGTNEHLAVYYLRKIQAHKQRQMKLEHLTVIIGE